MGTRLSNLQADICFRSGSFGLFILFFLKQTFFFFLNIFIKQHAILFIRLLVFVERP